LLTALGGLGAIRQASVEQLMSVKGIGERDARAVYEYFHGKGN
jgi:excinuclease ABC subunit C